LNFTGPKSYRWCGTLSDDTLALDQRRCTVHKPVVAVFVALAIVLAVAAVADAQSSDPWIGTWRVNLAKSTYSPGPKPTSATTVKLEPSPSGGLKTTIDGVDAKGQPTHTETVGLLDGKDNPVKGTPMPNSTTALKRIDGRTFEAVNKVDGKPTTTTRVVISADGKTLTATQTGKSLQGEDIKNVIVADRQ
jgi:hypothetical protein